MMAERYSGSDPALGCGLLILLAMTLFLLASVMVGTGPVGLAGIVGLVGAGMAWGGVLVGDER